MPMRIQGRWMQPIPMLIAWIMEHTKLPDITVASQPPADLRNQLPLIVVSVSPGGMIDSYTRSQAVDIDVYAESIVKASEVVEILEPCLASLQGDGNELGYVDSSTLTSFTQIDSRMGGVTRLTATITLDMRPQLT